MQGLGTTFAISINGNGNGTTASLIISTDRERGKKAIVIWTGVKECDQVCSTQWVQSFARSRSSRMNFCFFVVFVKFFLVCCVDCLGLRSPLCSRSCKESIMLTVVQPYPVSTSTLSSLPEDKPQISTPFSGHCCSLLQDQWESKWMCK